MDQPIFPAAPASGAGEIAAAAEPPELTPCIAELLRTRYIPPYLLLRVERVIDLPIAYSTANEHEHDRDHEEGNGKGKEKEAVPRHHTFRLFLSDSELLIQALLMRELHHFVSLDEVVPGSVMRVEKFRLRWAERMGSRRSRPSSAGGAKIAYLAVERFRTVWMPPQLDVDGDDAERRGIEGGEVLVKRRHARGDGDAGLERQAKRARLDDEDRLLGQHDVGGADEVSSQRPSTSEDALDQTPSNNIAAPTGCPTQRSPTVGIPQPISPSLPPAEPLPPTPNLLTLSNLLNPPQPIPQRNYEVSLLAVIASINPHTRQPPPHARLPPKREMRLMDTSLPFRSSGVQLSVFRDAESFHPPVGTIGLFVGLKTHEWEGVSLNAFEVVTGRSDGTAADVGEWFVDDRDRLRAAGFDVDGLERWWNQRCAMLGG